jgi:hypothetical protein
MLLMKGFFLCNKMLRLPFGLYLNQQSRNNERAFYFFFYFLQMVLPKVVMAGLFSYNEIKDVQLQAQVLQLRKCIIL